MRLRLPRWRRREPVPRGRHVRRPAPVTAPSAGAALVVGAAEPYLVVPTPLDEPLEEPVDRPLELPPAGPEPVTAGDQPLATEPDVPDTEADTEPPTEAVDLPDAGVAAESAEVAGAAPTGTPAETRTEPVPAPAAPEPTVALGFADGGVLELAADDPRRAGFQDAAAAVLGRPEA